MRRKLFRQRKMGDAARFDWSRSMPRCARRAPRGAPCARCGIAFPRTGGIADFAEGRYYDDFPGPRCSPRRTAAASPTRAKARASKASTCPSSTPRLRARRPRPQLAILDSGCGNGESVDVLSRFGFEAWGHDLSALRKWQWRGASGEIASSWRRGRRSRFRRRVRRRDRLRRPRARGRPGGGRRPLSRRADARPRRTAAAISRRALRVLAPDGRLFLDFPNGAFPIDFWHGVKPGARAGIPPARGFCRPCRRSARCARDRRRAERDGAQPRGPAAFPAGLAHWYGRALRAPMAGLPADVHEDVSIPRGVAAESVSGARAAETGDRRPA